MPVSPVLRAHRTAPSPRPRALLGYVQRDRGLRSRSLEDWVFSSLIPTTVGEKISTGGSRTPRPRPVTRPVPRSLPGLDRRGRVGWRRGPQLPVFDQRLTAPPRTRRAWRERYLARAGQLRREAHAPEERHALGQDAREAREAFDSDLARRGDREVERGVVRNRFTFPWTRRRGGLATENGDYSRGPSVPRGQSKVATNCPSIAGPASRRPPAGRARGSRPSFNGATGAVGGGVERAQDARVRFLFRAQVPAPVSRARGVLRRERGPMAPRRPEAPPWIGGPKVPLSVTLRPVSARNLATILKRARLEEVDVVDSSAQLFKHADSRLVWNDLAVHELDCRRVSTTLETRNAAAVADFAPSLGPPAAEESSMFRAPSGLRSMVARHPVQRHLSTTTSARARARRRLDRTRDRAIASVAPHPAPCSGRRPFRRRRRGRRQSGAGCVPGLDLAVQHGLRGGQHAVARPDPATRGTEAPRAERSDPDGEGDDAKEYGYAAGRARREAPPRFPRDELSSLSGDLGANAGPAGALRLRARVTGARVRIHSMPDGRVRVWSRGSPRNREAIARRLAQDGFADLHRAPDRGITTRAAVGRFGAGRLPPHKGSRGRRAPRKRCRKRVSSNRTGPRGAAGSTSWSTTPGWGTSDQSTRSSRSSSVR